MAHNFQSYGNEPIALLGRTDYITATESYVWQLTRNLPQTEQRSSPQTNHTTVHNK